MLSHTRRSPFTYEQARQCGSTRHRLRAALAAREVKRLLPGVYIAYDAPDDLPTRLAALRLVVPRNAVITDETAGWLLGAEMVLAPNSDVLTPTVSAFQDSPGRRLRNGFVVSGSRRLAEHDVLELDGLATTTALRTACDLGRLRHRFRAIAAIDQLLALGEFSRNQLMMEVHRFRGMRGVIQLRALAPVATGLAQSPPESVLALVARDADLRTLRPQVVANGPSGPVALDLADERLRFAVEYDGWEHHSSRADQAHDEHRRGHLRSAEGWHVAVVRGDGLYGRHADPHGWLRREYDAAVASFAVRRRRWAS